MNHPTAVVAGLDSALAAVAVVAVVVAAAAVVVGIAAEVAVAAAAAAAIHISTPLPFDGGGKLTVEFPSDAGPNKLVEPGPNTDWPAGGRFIEENMRECLKLERCCRVEDREWAQGINKTIGAGGCCKQRRKSLGRKEAVFVHSASTLSNGPQNGQSQDAVLAILGC